MPKTQHPPHPAFGYVRDFLRQISNSFTSFLGGWFDDPPKISVAELDRQEALLLKILEASPFTAEDFLIWATALYPETALREGDGQIYGEFAGQIFAYGCPLDLREEAFERLVNAFQIYSPGHRPLEALFGWMRCSLFTRKNAELGLILYAHHLYHFRAVPIPSVTKGGILGQVFYDMQQFHHRGDVVFNTIGLLDSEKIYPFSAADRLWLPAKVPPEFAVEG